MTRLPIDFTKHVFCYTASWGLRQDLAAFARRVEPEWAGKPMLYLQVGVDEGMVPVWMFQRVLTHPKSRAIGVIHCNQRGAERLLARARHNLQPWAERCVLTGLWHTDKEGIAEEEALPVSDGVDVCFVRGTRIHGWTVPLLKPNGWLIVNDGRKVEGLEHIWRDGRCVGYRTTGNTNEL